MNVIARKGGIASSRYSRDRSCVMSLQFATAVPTAPAIRVAHRTQQWGV